MGASAFRLRPQGAPRPGASGKAAAARVAVTAGEALGRSGGGLSTKIHPAVDGRGRTLSVLLSGGQAGDNPYVLPVLDAIAIRGPAGGRPRKRPDQACRSAGEDMSRPAGGWVADSFAAGSRQRKRFPGGRRCAGSGHVRVCGAVVSVLSEQVRLCGNRLGGQVVHPLGECAFLLGGR